MRRSFYARHKAIQERRGGELDLSAAVVCGADWFGGVVRKTAAAGGGVGQRGWVVPGGMGAEACGSEFCRCGTVAGAHPKAGPQGAARRVDELARHPFGGCVFYGVFV